MKTVNVKTIFEIIEAGSGTINSSELATICGVDDHTKFVKKMGTVLFGIARDSIPMDGLHAKISGHPNVRAQKVSYNLNNTRDEYLLAEREATLMAMTYSYELQAMVYDAYVMYRENMIKIANGANNPIALALQAIDEDAVLKFKTQGAGAVSRFVDKIFEKYDNPVEAHRHVMDYYMQSQIYHVFDKNTRPEFYNRYLRKVSKMRDEYRMTTKTKDYNMYKFGQFCEVVELILIRQRALARNSDTLGKKECNKLRRSYTKQLNAKMEELEVMREKAIRLGEHAVKNRDAKIDCDEVIRNLESDILDLKEQIEALPF